MRRLKQRIQEAPHLSPGARIETAAQRPLLPFAPSEEEQGADGAQQWSVLSVLDRASTGARERLPLGV